MENRRQHFRHPFGPSHRLRVKLTRPDNAASVEATVVNLSLGGMCVHADPLPADHANRWIAQFDDADSGFQLRIAAEPVYTNGMQEGEIGFRFLYPAYITKKEELEKVIWQFLLEEQRLERRQQRELQSKAG